MPELPEVEIIRRGLNSKIIGHTITGVKVVNSSSFQAEPALIIGTKIVKVVRRAKVLGLELSSEYTLVFHLKMSGQIIYIDEERFAGGHPTQDMLLALPNRSTRVIFEFDNGAKLFFNDQRKFGWIRLIKTSELGFKNFGLKTTIGPEPLSKDFSWQVLKDNLLKHKNLPIKVALLNQSIVAGIGNIYASEATFNAKVNPNKKVKDLGDDEIRQLYKGIKAAISDGIKYGGSTRTHFVNSEGKKGLFLQYAKVYNREGQKCKSCQNLIVEIKQAGRSTFVCLSCQE